MHISVQLSCRAADRAFYSEKSGYPNAVKTNTKWDAVPSACNHWPPMLAVIPAERGYKARCMTCGQVGPERETTCLAWAALLWSTNSVVDEVSASNILGPRGEVRGSRARKR